MNHSYLWAIFVYIAAATLASGCAQKHKPDIDNERAMLSKGIQDKDINLDSAGSDSGKIQGLYSVHFAFDDASLSKSEREILVKDAQWLKSHSEKSMQIEGHTDRNGSTEYNLALGQRRAEAVKLYLVNLGIAKNRFSTISYGKEQLLDTAETDEADAKNRRANLKPVENAAIKKLSIR